jgi:hypothetical protein
LTGMGEAGARTGGAGTGGDVGVSTLCSGTGGREKRTVFVGTDGIVGAGVAGRAVARFRIWAIWM